jgi:fibronectin-binding autotransporter adhesin
MTNRTRTRGAGIHGGRAALLASSALTLGLVLGQAGPARAQDWTGVVSDAWQDPGNWVSPSAVPNDGTPALINTTVPNGAVIDGISASASLVRVGIGSSGSLSIVNGGDLESGDAILGQDIGSTGVVRVEGPGSTWTIDQDTVSELWVGRGGSGTLTVAAGGAVSINRNDDTSGFLYVGGLAGSNGLVTVDGAGSTLGLYGADIGGAGDATLNIFNGGRVSVFASDGDSHYFGIATSIGSFGEVTVDGAGSGLTVEAPMYVATEGVGLLTISNGGQLNLQNTYDAFIGYGAEGVGEVTVDGAGSALTVGGDLYVSLNGVGTLTVSNGGLASASSVYINAGGNLNIGAGAADPARGAGILDAAAVRFDGAGAVSFNHTDPDYAFSASFVSGFVSGMLNQVAGTTRLTGDSSDFFGSLYVTGGTLVVEGSLAGGALVEGGTLLVNGVFLGEVANIGQDGVLGGSGEMSSIVNVGSGGTLMGVQGQTLTMSILTLDSGAAVDVTLDAPGGSALFDVVGDLSLDGALSVQSAGAFGDGVYRIFDYGGELTNNGLDIVATPGGTLVADFSVQTAVSGQINLVYGASGGGGAFNFWDPQGPGDGQVGGGSGVWSATAPNWTDQSGAANGPPDSSGLMIFTGAAGTVAVDGGAGGIAVAGMQFAVNGYRVEGDAITLAGAQTAIRVGDGTADGAGYTATIASALIGAGGLEKTDLGTLVLTGANSYAGGTIVTGGALVGAADSFGDGDITNNALLAIDAGTAAVFDNTLHGTGVFAKTGAGALTLTAESDFSGATEVLQGRLVVDGWLGQSIATLQSGTFLAGGGAVGGVEALAGSTVAPGNSIGTLTVLGDYAQASGSIYAAELAPNGTSDLIDIGGTATLAAGAGLQVIRTGPANAYVLGRRYTVLDAAGGVSGAYAVSGDTGVSAFIDLVAAYDATHVYLDVAQTHAFEEAGGTPNQIAAAGGADSLDPGAALFDAIVYLPTFAAARDAFDQVSGEIHASIRGAGIEDSRFVRDAALDRLGDAQPATAAWGRAFGSWAKIDGDGNAAALDRTIGGVLFGVDVAGGETWRIGVQGGFSHGEFEVDDRASDATSDDYHLGVYGGGQWGAWGVRAGAAYSWRQLEVDRSVAFAGFTDQLSSDYDIKVGQLFGEIAYRFDLGGGSLEPFAGLAFVALDADGADEKGGGAALDLQGDSSSVAFSSVGLRGRTSWAVDGRGTMDLRGSVGWRHAEGDVTPTATAAFAGGDAFTVWGVPIAEDALRLDAELAFTTEGALSLGVSYSGQIGDGAEDHGVAITARWRF